MFINTWETRQLSAVDKKGCKRQAHKKVGRFQFNWKVYRIITIWVYVGPFLTNFEILSCEYMPINIFYEKKVTEWILFKAINH